MSAHEALLNRYLELPDRLETVVRGLDEAQLDLKADDGWSIRACVHHLVEGELIWQINLRAAAGSDGIDFPMGWYFSRPQEDWGQDWGYDRRPVAPSLDLYRASTRSLAAFLRLVPPEIWKRAGRVTWPGEFEARNLSVRDIVLIQISHLDGHLADIKAVLEANGF
jgi:hypothetical protein